MELRSLIDAATRYMLIVLVALMPLVLIPTSWSSVGESKLVVAAVLVALATVFYIAGRLLEGEVALPRDLLFYTAAFLPLSYALAAYAGGRSIESYVSGVGSQDTVATMTILFAVLALCAMMFRSTRELMRALTALLCCCGIVILFQLARLAVPSMLSLGGALVGSASSIVGSWHDLGLLSVLLVFLATTLYDTPLFDQRVSRSALPTLGVLSFIMALVVNMADVFFALAAVLFVAGLYLWYAGRSFDALPHTHALRRSAVSWIVALLALAAAFGSSVVYSHFPSVLQIPQTEVRPSWQGTLLVGQKVFSDNGLIFGAGPNAFESAWDKFKPIGVNQTSFWGTDFTTGVGLIPTSFITAGTLGILAWLIFILAVFLHILHVMRADESRESRTVHVALILGALLLLSFHIIYTPSLALSVVLFALLGFSIALSSSGRAHVIPVALSQKSSRGILAVIALFIGALPALFLFALSVTAGTSDLLVQKAAADYNQSGQIAPALSLVQDALILNPKNDRAHRAAVELGLLQLQKQIAGGNGAGTIELQKTLQNTIAQGLDAVSIDSSDYQNWLTLAGLYQSVASAGVTDAYGKARSAYEKAAAANPTNPLPLIGAAQVALAQDDTSGAIGYLNAAALLKPDMAAIYFLRSQAESIKGETRSAIDDAKQAVALAQQDPAGWYNLGALLYTTGDYIDAALALQQAVWLNNTYSNALFVLALSYEQLHRHDDAIAALQKVVALNPNDSTASSTLAALIAASSTSATQSAPQIR